MLRGIFKRLCDKKTEKIFVPYIVKENELFSEKNAIVTGGGSGIGFAIASQLARQGCHVVLVGSNENKLKYAVEHIVNSTYSVIDLEKIEEIENRINNISTDLHGKIDILVNCAGVSDNSSFFSMTPYLFERVMRINVEGYYFVSKAVSKIMIENGIKGHILNVSSSSANRPAATPYKISKWAIRGMTLGLAQELLPYGIIVNAIAPGKTATKMMKVLENQNISCSDQPAERFCSANEVAQLAVFMVSDAANMIVGDTYYISGGNGTIMI